MASPRGTELMKKQQSKLFQASHANDISGWAISNDFTLFIYFTIWRAISLSLLSLSLSLSLSHTHTHTRCVDKNALLMSEVRGEWADWLEMIERQQ